WAPRDVQRHRGSLHPRRAQRRSKPSIGSESLFHNCNLPPLSPQVGFATLGRSGGFDDRAARPRELAERAGEEEWSRKPNPVEDPAGHRSGLQARATCRIPAPDGAGESDSLCPPVHGQQLRPDHFDSGSSLRDHQPTGVDAVYACGGHRGHCVADLRDPRAAVEGHRRRESMHLRPASLRLWEIWEAQVEGVKASRSAPSSTRGTSAQLAPGNAIQEGRGSRVPLLQAKGHEATASQHAFVRSSSACGHEGRRRSPAQGIWVPHFPANAGVGPSRQQLRSKTRAGTTPSFEHQNHPGRLCPSHYTGQAGGTGSLPEPATQRFMDGEGTSNELRCLAQTPRFVGILWASANRGIPNKCFEMWWPGTELNRRRQPFQGCALPPELPGHFLCTSRSAQRSPQYDGRLFSPCTGRSHWAGCREAKQPMRWDRAELSNYNNLVPFAQNGCGLGRAYPHRIPLARLHCLSEKRVRELAVRLLKSREASDRDYNPLCLPPTLS